MLLSTHGAVLLLVDLQERLVPAKHDGETMVARAVRLAEAAQLLDVPICATEQYPTGLGHLVPPLAAYPQVVLAKTAFSPTADVGFSTLFPPGTAEVVVAGCEAHVCVLQTVHGLLAQGLHVKWIADAVGSRHPADRLTATERARDLGADILTTEMVVFEWMATSRHPSFKAMSKLIR